MVPGCARFVVGLAVERERERIEKGDAFHYDVRFSSGEESFHGYGYGNQFRLGLRHFGITTPHH